MHPLLARLNPQQKIAVFSTEPQRLVVAGAGSGKTSVLIGAMLKAIEEGTSPNQILALTFTNKAALEMRQRLEEALSYTLPHMWMGTFHSIAHRILRIHHDAAGLPQNFQIIDTDDALSLIRALIKEHRLGDEFQPKEYLQFIAREKDAGHRAENFQGSHFEKTQRKLHLYQLYEHSCQTKGLVDFSELLLRIDELFAKNPDILQRYQSLFSLVLVDEFQDTNTVQYTWLKRLLLHSSQRFLFVGDDDQSIYGWRGAKVENVQQVLRDFPKTQCIRLEQNYRSTQNILSAANTLIAKNHNRLGKSLWSAGDEGEKITVYEAFDDREEAFFVICRIQRFMQKFGVPPANIAILYRSNAQSRLFEETLIRARIPYTVYGGMRFFDRSEIKDALAYLRLLALPDDDLAFERVINVPKRGIGESSLLKMRAFAKANELSLWAAIPELVESQLISPKVKKALALFQAQITALQGEIEFHSLGGLMHLLLEHSGLYQMYLCKDTEKEKNKFENLRELVNAATSFSDAKTASVELLTEFLASITLDSNDTEKPENRISLMTLHAAKGLEFPVVFIVGLEEGLFPSVMSLREPQQLEEERRLCYVGITRAMEHLFLSFAERRMVFGKIERRKASRFIQELPKQAIKGLRVTAHH